MNEDLEVLIGRYLDGTAAPEEIRRLDELIRSDPAVRDEVLKAARQTGDLREILAQEKDTREALRELKPARSRAPVVAAAGFLVLVGVVLFFGRRPPEIPAAPSPSLDSMNGWQVRSGSWSARDGVLTGTSVGSGSAIRIETERVYEDFELTCRIRLQGTTVAEVQIRSYARFLQLNWQEIKEWGDVRIVARGREVEATLNGTPYLMIPGTGGETPIPGTVAFYGGAGTTSLEVRDLRIRELGPK